MVVKKAATKKEPEKETHVAAVVSEGGNRTYAKDGKTLTDVVAKEPARVPEVVREGGARFYENDGERLIDEVVRWIPLIPETDYTDNGKPRVVDLETLMGEDITEGQRDQAFEIFNSRNKKTEQEGDDA